MAKSKAKRAKQKAKSPSGKSVDQPSQSLSAAPRLGERILNVLPDAPDLRDRIYQPALLDLSLSIAPPDPGQ